MAKTLKTLADQLWKNAGIALVSTFDTGIIPGTVLDSKNWRNFSRIGDSRSALPKDGYPPTEGPFVCALQDMTRSHELDVDAAVDLLRVPAKAAAHFKKAKDVTINFDSPVTYSIDMLLLEDLIESQGDAFWNKALGQSLGDKSTRIVIQVFKAKLSYMFRSAGGAGLDLQSSELGNLGEANLSAGYKWRNSATLESKNELVVAVEYAWYDKKMKRFRADKR